ncbi:MAG: TlpA disulfide reductase family protein [Polyangiaceae bacterium]|jgi:peroxiredoxin
MPAAPEPPPPKIGAILAQLGFVVVAALLVYGFVAVTKDGEMRRVCSAPCYLKPDYLAADRIAPNFKLKDLRGNDVTLDSLRGKVVVLNFWTRTCGPCLEEMPDLAELAVILRDRPDVAVVTVSTDAKVDEIKLTLQTILKAEPPFMVLTDPEADVVNGKYGTHLFPETWIIDKRGVIRARFDGKREWNDPLVVNFVDSLRAGDYCPVKIDGASLSGNAGLICREMTGTGT